MEILIENEQSKLEIDEEIRKLISDAVETSLRMENFLIPSEIDVMLVDDNRIKEINLEHRKINKPTDVLSFPLVDMKDGEIISDCGDFDLDGNLLLLGDIVISVETALRQSEEYGHSLKRELAFLTTHGVFHLLGYDHLDNEEEKRMIGKQETVLHEMGLKRI